MKTVEQIYTKVKALMNEKTNSTDYDGQLIEGINTLLVELFHENNGFRIKNGKEELTTIPEVVNRSDEMPYEDEMNNAIIPYGLASLFYLDDDMQKHGVFETKFINARSQLMPVMATSYYTVEDGDA